MNMLLRRREFIVNRSPYAQPATQFLRDNFTQDWYSIREFGYRNPSLVPFINEDPNVIFSLMDLGISRCLVSDGYSCINTNYVPTPNSISEFDGIMINPASDRTIIGARTGSNYYEIVFNTNIRGYWQYGSSSQSINFQDATNMHTYKNIQNKLYQDGVLLSTGAANLSQTTTITLFCMHRNNSSYERFIQAKIEYFKQYETDESDLRLWLVPFRTKTSRSSAEVSTGVAQPAYSIGMIDLISGIFFPNANTSGLFTIEEI